MVYHDSDADDEYERSVMTSPILPTDDDTSPTDSDPPSTEPTPTTFGHSLDHGKLSPSNTIVGWTTSQCADYISSLGLPQYCDKFLGEESSWDCMLSSGNGLIIIPQKTKSSAKLSSRYGMRS